MVQGPANQAQGPTVQNQDQGPAVQNQAQGPTVQNQAQVPAGQIPAQVPAVQVPVQGLMNQNQAQGPAVQIPAQVPTQVGQNIPIQPQQQPVPIQLAPAGIVMPAPQIIYQNWIGKKPAFQVSQKRMQNPISLVPETGSKHITSQKEIKLDISV